MGFVAIIKQSTAITVKVGPFVSASDGDTEMTGLTISQADVRLSKNGGNMAQKNESTTLAHDELGIYDCLLDATDTNTCGTLMLAVHEATALLVRHEFQVVEEAIYDAVYAASATGLLPANVTQFGGSNGTFASGRPEVNTTHIAGSAVNAASAQLGVNVVNFGGSAGTFSSGRPEVNVNSIGATGLSQVNGEVLDVLNVDTFAQPGQAAPAATTTIRLMLAWIYKFARNKSETTDSQLSIYNDDASTVDQKASVSDNGTTLTRGEMESGP